MNKDLRYERWKAQREQNEKLDRGAVAVTLRFGDSIELSNGISIVLVKNKGFHTCQINVIAPIHVKISRQVEAPDAQE